MMWVHTVNSIINEVHRVTSAANSNSVDKETLENLGLVTIDFIENKQKYPKLDDTIALLVRMINLTIGAILFPKDSVPYIGGCLEKSLSVFRIFYLNDEKRVVSAELEWLTRAYELIRDSDPIPSNYLIFNQIQDYQRRPLSEFYLNGCPDEDLLDEFDDEIDDEFNDEIDEN